jgi:hypothetical protein
MFVFYFFLKEKHIKFFCSFLFNVGFLLVFKFKMLLAIFLAKGFRYQKNGLKPTCPKFRAIMRPW